MTLAAVKAPTSHLDTWDLVVLTQNGDTEAFGYIYDRYVDRVHRFVYYRVGGHQVLTEDLVAETFCRALRRIDAYTRPQHDLASWLYTIARNIITDHFKSAATRMTTLVPDFPAECGWRGMGAAKNAESFPEHAVVEHAINLELLAAVRSLRHEHRECIVLRFLMGCSVQETADIMGRTYGAVKQMQARGLGSLRLAVPHLAATLAA